MTSGDFKNLKDANHAGKNVKEIVEVAVDLVAPVEGTIDDSYNLKKRRILGPRPSPI